MLYPKEDKNPDKSLRKLIYYVRFPAIRKHIWGVPRSPCGAVLVPEHHPTPPRPAPPSYFGADVDRCPAELCVRPCSLSTHTIAERAKRSSPVPRSTVRAALLATTHSAKTVGIKRTRRIRVCTSTPSHRMWSAYMFAPVPAGCSLWVPARAVLPWFGKTCCLFQRFCIVRILTFWVIRAALHVRRAACAVCGGCAVQCHQPGALGHRDRPNFASHPRPLRQLPTMQL